jgi:hypothetical protein
LLERLHGHGLFESGSRVLDIGTSNLYQADFEQVRDFILHYCPARPKPELEAFAARIASGSVYDTIKGGLNESFLGELLDYCGMKYVSFDIASAYKTTIFDLNKDELDETHRGSFDVVLNIGTTEHILNQYNCFKVVHEAAKAGGFIVHQLPVSGFTDHGYFIYTGRMFFDLAGYNEYEIIDLWYRQGLIKEDDLYTSLRNYKMYFPKVAELSDADFVGVPNYTLMIILRKKKDAPFVANLETSTSVDRNPPAVQDTCLPRALVKTAAVAPGRPTKLTSWFRRLRKLDPR